MEWDANVISIVDSQRIRLLEKIVILMVCIFLDRGM